METKRKDKKEYLQRKKLKKNEGDELREPE